MDEKNWILDQVEKCNVIYHKTGQSDRSAMPIGNGELCASVWVEESGKIKLYLARTDALTEFDRNVKLGMVEVTLSPNPFGCGEFYQILHMNKGQIKIMGSGVEISIFLDMEKEHLYVTGKSKDEVDITTEYLTWRSQQIVPHGQNCCGSDIVETMDIVRPNEQGILFYHKNGRTVLSDAAKLQQLEESITLLPDYLTNRIFGGLMLLEGGQVKRENTLEKLSARSFELIVITDSMQEEEGLFVEKLRQQKNDLKEHVQIRKKSEDAWEKYWQKSYIFINGDRQVESDVCDEIKKIKKEEQEYSSAYESQITKAYVWTKYMFACCGNGQFPIMYNGMLFNLCPGGGEHFCTDNFGRAFTEKPVEISVEHNPDERSWCVENLWQNIRHPYHTFLAQGDPEKMKVLFRYYRGFWEINRVRAKEYYHAQGQHNTEMSMTFGLQSMGIYGTDRERYPKGYSDNRYGGAVDISPGLELISFMLDYYDYTKEEEFLNKEVLPYTLDLLKYIETRFQERADGKIRLYPLHSVETYPDTENPIPTVAGLHSVLNRLIEIDIYDPEKRRYVHDFKKLIPELPMEMTNKGVMLKPAKQYDKKRQNVEIPELYACFPFRLFTAYKNECDIMKRTFHYKIEKYGCNRKFKIGQKPDMASYSGWQYTGIVASLLGETEMAADILENNCSLKNPGTRFPAMWGPVYDAVPDTDHGANIVHQLQMMVMQTEGKEIYILPAFPEKWDVVFKLHADKDTTVTCEYQKGKLERLEVTPEIRKKNIHICR